MILVSVVIPVGSVGQELRSQLVAVLAQELDGDLDGDAKGDMELVLSLNRPGAAARDELERLVVSVGDPRVRIVDSSGRAGAHHARNVGAAAASGDLLAFCDADDIVERGWLQALVEALATYDAVSGYVSEERWMPERQRHWRPPATPGKLPSFLGAPYLLSGNLGITRKAFEDVGGFDTTLTRCEDIAISWALTKRGYDLGYAPDAVLHYRHREGLLPMLRQHFLYGRGMSEVLLRHGRPGDSGQGTATLFKANAQRVERRSAVSVARRACIAAGRLYGLAAERFQNR